MGSYGLGNDHSMTPDAERQRPIMFMSSKQHAQLAQRVEEAEGNQGEG